jgi:hypothetical protein
MHNVASSHIASAAPIPASFTKRYQPIADGCFRDIGRLHLAEDGPYYLLEWTPTLNKKSVSRSKGLKLITDCKLAGGGFSAPTASELETLADRSVFNPATYAQLKEDTQSALYFTSEIDASSSVCAWFVNFGDGLVLWSLAAYDGFARGVRRVVVSPGQ